jgi:hypothetical protein
MKTLIIILCTVVVCGLSGGIYWLFMPQYARGPFKATVILSALVGAVIAGALQWAFR